MQYWNASPLGPASGKLFIKTTISPNSEQQPRTEKRQLAKKTKEITHVKCGKNFKCLPSTGAINLLQQLFFSLPWTKQTLKQWNARNFKAQIIQCKLPWAMIHSPSRGSVTPEQTDAAQMRNITANRRKSIFNFAKPMTLLTVYATKNPTFFCFSFCSGALHFPTKQTRNGLNGQNNDTQKPKKKITRRKEHSHFARQRGFQKRGVYQKTEAENHKRKRQSYRPRTIYFTSSGEVQEGKAKARAQEDREGPRKGSEGGTALLCICKEPFRPKWAAIKNGKSASQAKEAPIFIAWMRLKRERSEGVIRGVAQKAGSWCWVGSSLAREPSLTVKFRSLYPVSYQVLRSSCV